MIIRLASVCFLQISKSYFIFLSGPQQILERELTFILIFIEKVERIPDFVFLDNSADIDYMPLPSDRPGLAWFSGWSTEN